MSVVGSRHRGDFDPSKLALAENCGADLIVDTSLPDEAVERIRAVAGPRRAAFVLDCVGVQATADLARRVVGLNSQLTIVGLGNGVLPFGNFNLPYGCALSTPYWGSRAELMEVVAPASAGRIRAETSTFDLEEGPAVLQRLQDGLVSGRAVLVPSAL
jgi:alcohol dehydrogenase, propanol-preferring